MSRNEHRRGALSLTLALALLVGCGARTELPDRRGDGGVDAVDPDAIVPDPRALGTWHYATVRAICDLLVLQFCDEGHAVVSVQYDGCSSPDEPSSVSYDVRWETPTRFRLSLRGDGRPPPGISAELVFEYEDADDSLVWVDPSPPFSAAFPVESGRGPGPPWGLPPPVAFAVCP